MDISSALVAKSDQLNAIDIVGQEVTITVVSVDVKQGTEQPVSIVTDVFGPSRPFKPSKTVLRIIADLWTPESAAWVGKSMTIYRDPAVRWAGEAVGGIRVKAMSDIPKGKDFTLLVSKGKYAKYNVTPLRATPPRDWPAEITAVEHDYTALLALHKDATRTGAGEAVLNAIKAAGTRAKEAQG